MPPTSDRAVFLSYASQDADAARRICEALRAAGVEVWFDQSELVGGDAWDAKIRKQIKDCALFVPIISANTQARHEGYFRLEWKLAAQRTRAIADGIPFLLPVVIDATRDDTALVPEEFCTVQWTRMPGSEAPTAFCERVSKLIAANATPETAHPLAAGRGGQSSKPTSAARGGGWVALAAAVGLLAAGAGYYFGVYAPEQTRLALEREKSRQLEIAQQTEQARLQRERIAAEEAARAEQQKLLAEQQRLAAARGGIIVRTVPAGAEVTVGALEHGPSPLTVKDARLGKYPVTVRLAGYEEQRLEVEVKVENEFTPLDLTLVRLLGAAEVASTPTGLPFTLASKEKTVRGTTPAKFEKLPTGDYTLTATRNGWPEQTQRVSVARDQTVHAKVEFVGGALEISSTPAGAEVFRDGQKLGVTPLKFDDTPPGARTLEFRLNGYKVATARGEVRAKDTARINATLVPEEVAKAPPPKVDAIKPDLPRPLTIPSLDMTLMPLGPGTFTMGSPANEPGRGADESPQTRVTISKLFWLGTTEVTQRQWSAVMSGNPSKFNGASLPVEQVTWTEAMEFCRKLNEHARAAKSLPAGYAFTLPTEAQWEFACRAGSTRDTMDALDAVAWYGQQAGLGTHPVGTKQANGWGLYDMLGNVSEWCRDWKGAYPGGTVNDFIGPATGNVRVMRGGKWGDSAQNCRSAHRASAHPESRAYIGFRVALSPEH